MQAVAEMSAATGSRALLIRRYSALRKSCKKSVRKWLQPQKHEWQRSDRLLSNSSFGLNFLLQAPLFFLNDAINTHSAQSGFVLEMR